MSDNTKADLEAVLELATQAGSVPVKSYQRTSVSGKPYTVSAATRGAPGPKNGITNPGGALRSGTSAGRQANYANRNVSQAMGSGNTVTVGAVGVGRSPLNPYTASGVANPNAIGYQNAAARAAQAGAAVQSAANAAATAANAAKTAYAKTPYTAYAKKAYTPYTKKPYTAYAKTAATGASSSKGSKLATGLKAAMLGASLASLGHSAIPHIGGVGFGRNLAALRSRNTARNTASQDARADARQTAHDTASRTAAEHAHETASRTAHDTASRTAAEHAHETASRTARLHAHETASRHARESLEHRETIRRDDDRVKSLREMTNLTSREILDLQVALSRKGYPVKVDGQLSKEFIVIANAYLKATN